MTPCSPPFLWSCAERRQPMSGAPDVCRRRLPLTKGDGSGVAESAHSPRLLALAIAVCCACCVVRVRAPTTPSLSCSPLPLSLSPCHSRFEEMQSTTRTTVQRIVCPISSIASIANDSLTSLSNRMLLRIVKRLTLLRDSGVACFVPRSSPPSPPLPLIMHASGIRIDDAASSAFAAAAGDPQTLYQRFVIAHDKFVQSSKGHKANTLQGNWQEVRRQTANRDMQHTRERVRVAVRRVPLPPCD